MKLYASLFLASIFILQATCTPPATLETAVAEIEQTEPAPDPTDFPTVAPQLPRPESCPITRPQTPVFVPPEPYAPVGPNGEFWYGSNELWTLLRPDGTWHSLPKSEAGYGNKVVWFREGYDWTEEPEPELALSARQLDGDGVVEKFVHATNGYHPDYNSFMLSGIELPDLGCWEITGEYNGHTLSFVVWVSL